MADIDVVPKRGVSMWVWIILAAVIVIGLWWFLGRPSTEAPRTGRILAAPAVVADGWVAQVHNTVTL